MLTIKEPRIMWAWVCPITGMVLDEGWGATLPYAKCNSERYMGKRRAACGEMRAVKVTIEPLSDDEQRAHEAEYEAWKGRATSSQVNAK